MSITGKLVDDAVGGGLAGTLRAAGFKKAQRTFRRARDGVVHVVNVQASQWNGGNDASFTMNLAVYIPAIQELRGGEALAAPKEHECQLRQRIGRLLRSGQDHWWKIRAGDDVEACAREVDAAYRDHGEAWLEARGSVARCLALWPHGRILPRDAAALAIVGGRVDLARVLLAGLEADEFSRELVADVRDLIARAESRHR